MPGQATLSLLSESISLGSDGPRETRVYKVTGAGSLAGALTATGVPVRFSGSGNFPGALALDYSVSWDQEDPGAARVEVVFRFPVIGSNDSPPGAPGLETGGTIQISSRVQPETRTKDINGNQIKVQHTFANAQSTLPTVQPAEVEVQVATAVLVIERQESQSPLDKAKAHVGKTNATAFAGEAAGLWLCTGIEGSSEDEGLTYTVSYEFELKPNGWQSTVVYIDEKTGRPIDGIVEGVEIQTYTVYESSNFGVLNLGV